MTEAELLEKTYFDTCNIYRKIKIKDENTGITSEKEVLVDSCRCALSKGSLSLTTGDGVSNIVNTHKIFTGPTVDIRANDTIEVTSMGVIKVFIAGEPFSYISHKEISLENKERV